MYLFTNDTIYLFTHRYTLVALLRTTPLTHTSGHSRIRVCPQFVSSILPLLYCSFFFIATQQIFHRIHTWLRTAPLKGTVANCRSNALCRSVVTSTITSSQMYVSRTYCHKRKEQKKGTKDSRAAKWSGKRRKNEIEDKKMRQIKILKSVVFNVRRCSLTRPP